MTNERRKDAEILSDKVDEIIKQRDDALKNITNQISSLMMERDKISEPYQKQIENLKEEYMDKYLKDSKGNSIKVGDKLIHNTTKQKYEVVDRYQQRLFRYLGNPRVCVHKIKENCGLGAVGICLFTDELKNYTKID